MAIVMFPSRPRLLAILALVAPASAGEITASLTGGPTLSGAGEGLFLFGTWPMPASEELRNLKAVSAISGCTALDDNNLQGKTAVVFGASACDGLSLYYMLQQQHAARVIVVSASADADVGQRNWGLSSESVPSWIDGLGNIYGVPNAWAAPMLHANLDAAVLRVVPKVTPLTLGAEASGSVVRGHMSLYSFEAPTSNDLSYTITVTPTAGNPNLYVNTGSSVAGVRLPDFGAESTHTDPGDDALDLRLIRDHQAFVVGVYGESASDYTLVLSQADTVVPLLSGESKRFSVAAGQFRYFVATVPHGAMGGGLNVAVTPFSGDPDLFVSLASSRPDSVAPECAASSGHPSWCSGNAPGRYEHVEIGADDSSRCSLAECPYYIGVLAKNVASTFSVVAAWGDTPIRLVDGVPQAGQLGGAGAARAYKTRVAGSHTDLSIALTNTYGNAHIYVQAGHAASPADATWTSNTLETGDERLLISHADTAHFCVDCDYFVSVVADGATSYTITATSSHGVTVLENGAPCNEVVNAGEYEYFKLFVTAQLVEVQVIMTAFSGNPDVFVSLTEPYPNATSATWRSTDVEGDVITISNVAFDSRPKSEALDACLNPPEGSLATRACVLYISVFGFEGASSFSLAADARALSSGFHVDAPTGSAGDYEFTVSTFGAPMPRRPLSAPVVKASPLSACGAGLTSDGNLANAADVAGAIAWVERGPHDASCPYPGRYFANKVAVAQRAGAVAVIMSNNDAEHDGLIYMGAVSSDASSAVSIPSVFVTHQVGLDVIQHGLTEGVRVSLSQPLGRLPLLVNGVPQAGAAAANQMKYYEVFMSPGNDELTINVNPRFGNPDVYVTSSVRSYSLPTRDDFGWSSTAEGSETLTIAHGDEYACSGVSGCRYWIGVLGGPVGGDGELSGAASTTFTIMTSIDEAMMTLQSNVPLPSQDVALLAYKYYRFYVDRPGQGVTVALTLDSGDADLFVAFDVEHPTEGHAQFVANGQTGCQTVDCGNSIAGGDAVHISAAQVQEHCRLPCLAYIGVRGTLAVGCCRCLGRLGGAGRGRRRDANGNVVVAQRSGPSASAAAAAAAAPTSWLDLPLMDGQQRLVTILTLTAACNVDQVALLPWLDDRCDGLPQKRLLVVCALTTLAAEAPMLLIKSQQVWFSTGTRSLTLFSILVSVARLYRGLFYKALVYVMVMVKQRAPGAAVSGGRRLSARRGSRERLEARATAGGGRGGDDEDGSKRLELADLSQLSGIASSRCASLRSESGGDDDAPKSHRREGAGASPSTSGGGGGAGSKASLDEVSPSPRGGGAAVMPTNPAKVGLHPMRGFSLGMAAAGGAAPPSPSSPRRSLSSAVLGNMRGSVSRASSRRTDTSTPDRRTESQMSRPSDHQSCGSLFAEPDL